MDIKMQNAEKNRGLRTCVARHNNDTTPNGIPPHGAQNCRMIL